jgi:predicted Zn-dependent protease
VSTSNEQDDRLLSETQAQDTLDVVTSTLGREGVVSVSVQSLWFGGVRIMRNRPAMTVNRRDVAVTMRLQIGTSYATTVCNQIDPDSLRGAVRYLEHYVRLLGRQKPLDMQVPSRAFPSTPGRVWSDHTYTPDLQRERSVLALLLERSDSEGVLSSGYLESFATNVLRYARDVWGSEEQSKGKLTQAQFSMTSRVPDGNGSGWAGRSAYDRISLPLEAIGRQAIDKCIASRAPVRLEPGRYTTILEPQAAYVMFAAAVAAMQRDIPESNGESPYLLEYDPQSDRYISRLGLKIFDERITIRHDPADPLTGTLDTPGVQAITYVENGVLVNMANSVDHSIIEMAETTPQLPRNSFTVTGTSTTLDEMIASTKRGLLVTRFSDPMIIDPRSLLMTGFTRDGLWLIENGKITHAVRNFRFTESPMFAFNNIEQIGIAEPIWNPVMNRELITTRPQSAIASAVVPSMKIRDFSFTTTIDAV